MSKKEEPVPPPSFGGHTYVTMLESEEPQREPTPAHQVQAFHRRKELADQDDPSDEDAGVHMGTYVRKMARRGKRWLRWLVADPSLITDQWYADHTANELLQAGFKLDDIAIRLNIDTLSNWFHPNVDLKAPLTRPQWDFLIDDFGLRYIDLFAQFKLQNVRQYVEAGIGPAILSKLGVTFDTLLDESRVDAKNLNVFRFQDWKNLGMSALHLGRLGPDALDAFTIRQWRSVGMTKSMLSVVDMTVEQLAERKNLPVERVLSALVAEGEYGLHAVQMAGIPDARIPRTHTHKVWVHADGSYECSEAAGHTHAVVDGVVEVVAGHSHELVRYV